MIQSISVQEKFYNRNSTRYASPGFKSKPEQPNVIPSNINPAKAKRKKILKTSFFVFLGIKAAMLGDIIFAKGKHLKAIWGKLRSVISKK